MDHKRTGCKDLDGIKLAQGKVHWQDVVNTIMKLCHDADSNLAVPL
jgi:hypothetical protein